MRTSAIQHFFSMLISMFVPCYLERLLSAIQHSCSTGTIKLVPFTASSYFILYRIFGYLLYYVPLIHYYWSMQVNIYMMLI